MRQALMVFVLLLALSTPAHAITLQEFQDGITAWVMARVTAISNRVNACIAEPGGPEKCHTAWAASAYCNNTSAAGALCDLTLDDPGTFADTVCGTCYTDEQTFALAGISIPGTAPLNAKINIMTDGSSWGVQLVVRGVYEGDLWERGWATGIAPAIPWRIVEGVVWQLME